MQTLDADALARKEAKRKLVGSRISLVRNARGLTQQQLADLITDILKLPAEEAIDRTYVARWECGLWQPNKYLPAIAQALDVPEHYLLGYGTDSDVGL